VLGLPAFAAFGPWGEVFGAFTHPVFAQAIAVAHVEEHAPALWPFLVAWLVAVGAGGLGWAMYAGNLRAVPARFVEAFPALWRFAVEKFRVDELYDWLVIHPIQRISHFLWKAGDAFLIDGILVNGTARAADALARIFRTLQNGDVQRYAAVMAVAVAAILWSVLGRGGN